MNRAVDPEMIRVAYGMSVHGEEEIAAVNRVLRTSTQMGAHVREFEQEVAGLFGKKHGIMVNSGSSALLLAVELLDLSPGSEVITPALTFATTVSSILKNGLIPAYVDVEEGTYCVDPRQVEAMITPNTRAMCIPNLVGNICEWERLSEIAKRYGLRVIEDSADTLGGTLSGYPTGHWSDISITSFYGSHVINCAGNGGMLCSNDDEHARRAKLLRSWGRSSSLFVDSEAVENRFKTKVDDLDYDAKFLFEAVGYNLEPSELGAAFGLVQLRRLKENIEARVRHFHAHCEFFKQYQKWFVLPRQTAGAHTGWLAFPLTLREGAPFSRKDMQIFMEGRNIQTRVVFAGNITRQPGFRDTRMRKSIAGYPEADKVMKGGVLLGCHHGLTPVMMDHVHKSFAAFAKSYQ